MHLQEFFDYKNKLVEQLVTDNELVSLLNDEIAFEDAPSLIYKQIFPTEYIPETTQDGFTYICCDVDITYVSNKTFLSPVLYIWVFAHRSRMRLPEGGVRTDKICSRICELINGSRYYGLGELNLYSVKRFAPMSHYNGKLMTFYAKDFNRQYDGKKPIPSNRKTE